MIFGKSLNLSQPQVPCPGKRDDGNIHFKGLFGGSKEIIHLCIINQKPPYEGKCIYSFNKSILCILLPELDAENSKVKATKLSPP